MSSDPKSNWPTTEVSPLPPPAMPDGTPWPKISIVTPSFNQGRYLEKTIQSVISQNYPNLEYIIVDGGSTDNSLEIINKYQKHLSWWVSEPDRGQSHAINKGADRSTGVLISWLNSDDYLMPSALYNLAELYHENPHAGAFIGAGQMVDLDGTCFYYREPGEICYERLLEWINLYPFSQSSCFLSKEAWLECGPLDESLHFTMDVDLWLKVSKKHTFATSNYLYSTALRHPEAKTTAFDIKTSIDLAIVLMRHGGESQAREILNSIENRLSFAEPNVYKIRLIQLKRTFSQIKKAVSIFK